MEGGVSCQHAIDMRTEAQIDWHDASSMAVTHSCCLGKHLDQFIHLPTSVLGASTIFQCILTTMPETPGFGSCTYILQKKGGGAAAQGGPDGRRGRGAACASLQRKVVVHPVTWQSAASEGSFCNSTQEGGGGAGLTWRTRRPRGHHNMTASLDYTGGRRRSGSARRTWRPWRPSGSGSQKRALRGSAQRRSARRDSNASLLLYGQTSTSYSTLLSWFGSLACDRSFLERWRSSERLTECFSFCIVSKFTCRCCAGGGVA